MVSDSLVGKKEKIMEAALKVFKKKGPDKASVREIMSESGFGLGTFYLYYTDKNDLKEKIVLDKAMDIIIKAENNCEGEDPIERYISFVDYIIAVSYTHLTLPTSDLV